MKIRLYFILTCFLFYKIDLYSQSGAINDTFCIENQITSSSQSFDVLANDNPNPLRTSLTLKMQSLNLIINEPYTTINASAGAMVYKDRTYSIGRDGGIAPEGTIVSAPYYLQYSSGDGLPNDSAIAYFVYSNDCSKFTGLDSINPAPLPFDTDGDGIVDNLDTDDDNDGIADILEGNSKVSVSLNATSFPSFTEGNVMVPNSIVDTNVQIGSSNQPIKSVKANIRFGKMSNNTAFGVSFNTNFSFIIVNSEATNDSIEVLYEFSEPLNQTIKWQGGSFNSSERYEITFGSEVLDVQFTDIGSGALWQKKSGVPNTYILSTPNTISATNAQRFTINVVNTSIILFKRIDDGSAPTLDGGLRIRELNIGFKDFDKDGIANHLDLDSDNDGIPDIIEAQARNSYTTTYSSSVTPPLKTNGLDFDFLNLDSDGDSFFDLEESGLNLLDLNKNGIVDEAVGVNGLANSLDVADNYQVPYGIVATPDSTLLNYGGNYVFRIKNVLNEMTAVDDYLCVTQMEGNYLSVFNNDELDTTSSYMANVHQQPKYGALQLNIIGDGTNFQNNDKTAVEYKYDLNQDFDVEESMGVDSFIYKLTNQVTNEISFATVYINLNSFGLIESPDTICDNKFTLVGNEVWSPGHWEFDSLEVIVDDANLSNTSLTVIGNKATLTWVDDLFTSCADPIEITLSVIGENDSIKIHWNENANGRKYCLKESAVNLFDQIKESLKDGVWKIEDVVTDSLKPLELGVGTFDVTFVGTTTNDCIATLSSSIRIVDVSADWNYLVNICPPSDTIDLNNYAVFDSTGENLNPAQYYWLVGDSIFDGIIRPTEWKGGDYIITHFVEDGCIDEVIKTITIFDTLQDATWSGLDSIYCNSVEPINLNGLTRADSSGTWYVNNSETNLFDPNKISDSYEVSYVVGNEFCKDTLLKIIKVVDSLDATWLFFDSVYCSNAQVLTLDNIEKNTSGGSWYLDSQSISTLEINALDDQPHDLAYTVSGLCPDTMSLNFRVVEMQEPSWDFIDSPICNFLNPISFSGLNPMPPTGQWKYDGIDVLSDELPLFEGSGIHTLEYAFQKENCSASTSDTISFITPVVQSTDTIGVCGNTISILSLSDTTEGFWLEKPSELNLVFLKDSLVANYANNGIVKGVYVSRDDYACSSVVRYNFNFVQRLNAINAGDSILLSFDEELISLFADLPTYGYQGTWLYDSDKIKLDDEGANVTNGVVLQGGTQKLIWLVDSDICPSVSDSLYIEKKFFKISGGISPNDDDKNDKFEILGLSESVQAHLTIINRWGQIIFESQDYKNDWYGEVKGSLIPVDVYYYTIKLSTGETYKGSLVVKN